MGLFNLFNQKKVESIGELQILLYDNSNTQSPTEVNIKYNVAESKDQLMHTTDFFLLYFGEVMHLLKKTSSSLAMELNDNMVDVVFAKGINSKPNILRYAKQDIVLCDAKEIKPTTSYYATLLNNNHIEVSFENTEGHLLITTVYAFLQHFINTLNEKELKLVDEYLRVMMS